MTYKLKFLPAALKEWEKLAPLLKSQFKKKLAERLDNPHVPASKLLTKLLMTKLWCMYSQLVNAIKMQYIKS